MRSKWEWLAPACGVFFLVFIAIAIAIAGEPPDVKDDSVQEIIDFYGDNKDEQYIGALFGMLGMFSLLVFGAYLRKLLSRAEGEAGFLSALSLAGLIILTVGLAFDLTINIALAETADDIEPDAVQALSALWNNDWVPMAFGLLVFLAATGISVVRHGVLPKWIGWVMIVLAVLALTPAGFVAFLAGAVLIVICGAVLAMRARRRETPAAV